MPITKIPRSLHPRSIEAKKIANTLPDLFECPHCGAINIIGAGMILPKCSDCNKTTKTITKLPIIEKLTCFYFKQHSTKLMQLTNQWLKDKSFHTRRPYVSRLKVFVEYCMNNDIDPLAVDVEEIQQYHVYRTTQVDGVTANEEVFTILKSFFTFLYKKGHIQFHPVKDKIIQVPIEDGTLRQKTIPLIPFRPKKKRPEAISAPTFNIAFSFALTPINSYEWQGDPKFFKGETMYSYRDGLLMLTMLAFGLRRKDPTLLGWDNVDLPNKLIYFSGRKNNRDTWMPIPQFVLPFFDYYWLCVNRRPSWRKNKKFFIIGNDRTVAERIRRYYSAWVALKSYNKKEIQNCTAEKMRKEMLLLQNEQYFKFANKNPRVFRREDFSFRELTPHGIFRKTWYSFLGIRLPESIRNYLIGHSTASSGLNTLMETYASQRDYVLQNLSPLLDEVWKDLEQNLSPYILSIREQIIFQINHLRPMFKLDPYPLERYYTKDSTKICFSCQGVLKISDKFCPHCGEDQESSIIRVE